MLILPLLVSLHNPSFPNNITNSQKVSQGRIIVYMKRSAQLKQSSSRGVNFIYSKKTPFIQKDKQVQKKILRTMGTPDVIMEFSQRLTEM